MADYDVQYNKNSGDWDAMQSRASKSARRFDRQATAHHAKELPQGTPQSSVGEILVDILHTSQPSHAESFYDEVLREVSARVADQGSIGKTDIGALVVWKRISARTKWAKQLMNMPEADVRAATERVFAHANDESVRIPVAAGAARSALFGVPGMGGTGAFASTVLLAMSPTRMAVWDKRVATTLTAMDRKPKSGRGHYARYLEVVIDLAEAMQEATDRSNKVLPREVDLALYHAAGTPEVLELLRQRASR